MHLYHCGNGYNTSLQDEHINTVKLSGDLIGQSSNFTLGLLDGQTTMQNLGKGEPDSTASCAISPDMASFTPTITACTDDSCQISFIADRNKSKEVGELFYDYASEQG